MCAPDASTAWEAAFVFFTLAGGPLLCCIAILLAPEPCRQTKHTQR
ncbi:hypothetical protein ETTORE_0335 [Pseudomonas phage Ettore]|nr:hypothetical protein ETTORE_0335 [Pseudomonas phage Ettore]